MKKIIKTIVLGLSLVGTVGCSGFLDEMPDGSIPQKDAIRDLDDLEKALIGVYTPLKGMFSGGVVLYPDIQTDLAYSVIGFSNTVGQVYAWDFSAQSSEVSSVWSGSWNAIMRANFLLENATGLPLKTTADSLRYKHVLGETHFIRALIYSEMVKFYCDPYGRKLGGEKVDPKSQLGLPVYNKFGVSTPARVNMYDYYQSILEDLRIAKANVTRTGEDEKNNIYVTVGAVRALEARVYLYMEEWEKAVEAASYVIDKCGYELLDAKSGENSQYAGMWVEDKGREIIMKIAFTKDNMGGALGNLFYRNVNGKYNPDYVPAKWVLDLYEKSDARYSIFFKKQKTAYSHKLEWPLLKKYPGNPALWSGVTSNYTNMPKVFRLSEMYLIRAEAYLEWGKEGDAQKDLQTLRAKRIGSPAAITDVRKTLRDERVRELYMEGHRLYDLKRWGMGFERTPQESSVYPGNDIKKEKTDIFFTWPIPSHELDVPGSQIVGNPSNSGK